MEIEKLIFISKEKQKEWDDVSPQVKRMVTYQLNKYAEEMKFNVAIDVLCHTINDLSEKIHILEKKIEDLPFLS